MIPSKKLGVGSAILLLTAVSLTGCSTRATQQHVSGTTPLVNQTDSNTTHSTGASSHAHTNSNTVKANTISGNSSSGNTTVTSTTSNGQAPDSVPRFPSIIDTAMKNFPSSVLNGSQAPTVLPTSNSGSNQLFYRTSDTTSGPILSYSVQLSSPHNRLATVTGSTFSGLSAGGSIWLPNGVPNGRNVTKSSVHLSSGIVATEKMFKAPTNSAKEISSNAITWREGRWQIEVARTQSTQAPIVEADAVAAFLHSHFMPVPRTKGAIYVNVFPGENAQGQPKGTGVSETIKWQEGSHVYEIDTYSHCTKPIQTGLAMAISMEPYHAVPSSGGSGVRSPHVTLESVSVNANSLTLYTTHGTMQTAYANPRISQGVFTVDLVNMSLATGLSAGKTYSKDGMSYAFTDDGRDLILTCHFASNPPTTVRTGIGGGDMIGFTFK